MFSEDRSTYDHLSLVSGRCRGGGGGGGGGGGHFTNMDWFKVMHE